MAAHHRPQAHRHAVPDFDQCFLLDRRFVRHAGSPGVADSGGRSDAGGYLQQGIHHARHHHGVFLPDSVGSGGARQFSCAADDRGEGPGVSPHQPAELVHLRGGRLPLALHDHHRRGRYRLDVLHAAEHRILQHPRHHRSAFGVHRRLLFDLYRPELHRHHSPHARPRDDLAAAALVPLVELRGGGHHGAGHAGAGGHAAAGGIGARLQHRRLQSGTGRRPAALPAPLLVLLAPGGVHHDPARHGRGQRNHSLFLAQAGVRLQRGGAGQHWHCGSRLPGVGSPHVRRRHFALRRIGILAAQLSRRDSIRHQGLRLVGHDVQGLDPLRYADAVRLGFHRPVHHRRSDGAVSRLPRS